MTQELTDTILHGKLQHLHIWIFVWIIHSLT